MSGCGTQSVVRRHNDPLVAQVTVRRHTMTTPAGPFSSKFPLNGSSIIRRTRTRGPKWQDGPAPVKRGWRDALQPQASSLDARLSLANGVSEALGRQSVSATAGRMNAPAWKAKLGGKLTSQWIQCERRREDRYYGRSDCRNHCFPLQGCGHPSPACCWPPLRRKGGRRDLHGGKEAGMGVARRNAQNGVFRAMHAQPTRSGRQGT